MPHPTVKIEIPKMAVDQNTRKILGVKIPFLSHLLVSMFVVSIPFPPGMLGPTSQSTLQIMEGTHKNIITHYIYTHNYIYIHCINMRIVYTENLVSPSGSAAIPFSGPAQLVLLAQRFGEVITEEDVQGV